MKRELTESVRVSAIRSIGTLCAFVNLADFSSRIIHPLARVLADPASSVLRADAMETLLALAGQMRLDYAIYIPMIDRILRNEKIQNAKYELFVSRLLKNQADDDANELAQQERGNDADEFEPVEAVKKLHINAGGLRKAWENAQRSTKEDWSEWIRRFSVEIVRESPSPALRSCLSLAQDYHPLVQELFCAGFYSCWMQLPDLLKEDLVASLERALSSPTIPQEILQTLLNLAEFMEHFDQPLPVDPTMLGALAEKCHAYAKALRYKEIEFQSSPLTTLGAMITIYTELQEPESARGVLRFAQQTTKIEFVESWFEKLGRWEDALSGYEEKQADDPANIELMIGRIRCLDALGLSAKILRLVKEKWLFVDGEGRRRIAPVGAYAAWNMQSWDSLVDYAQAIPEFSHEGAFYRAVSAIEKLEYAKAEHYIALCRELADPEVTALVGESYARAYDSIVRLQKIAELEEVIEYKTCEREERRRAIVATWTARLLGMERSVGLWEGMLAVRGLVLSAHEDLDVQLKFVSLCQKTGRLNVANEKLNKLMGFDSAPAALNASAAWIESAHPRVKFACAKQLWVSGRSEQAIARLRELLDAERAQGDAAWTAHLGADAKRKLLARAHIALAAWRLQQMESGTMWMNVEHVIESMKKALDCDPKWYKAWRAWALLNFEIVSSMEANGVNEPRMVECIVHALQGFFQSIALSPQASFQDTLRLLSLWFRHGGLKEVAEEMSANFLAVAMSTWLQTIPQLIARIHSSVPLIREKLYELLVRVGTAHPQALIYPLTVASKSHSSARVHAAEKLMDELRRDKSDLTDQALMVSKELIRTAILWPEMWHEGLEEASKLFFAEKNVHGMLEVLERLHGQTEKPKTLREISFLHAFGRELDEGRAWCERYRVSGAMADVHQAWASYFRVYRSIVKQLPQLVSLELDDVSPKLKRARDLELCVPGTYRANSGLIRIAKFDATLAVITSKQRPRKITIHGSDGKSYQFLLKGHEDLRQDERVMQLFELINSLLHNDSSTSRQQLSIRRYPVVPLSQNSGVIGWIPHTETLHQLIRQYREKEKITLNKEVRLIAQVAPDYEQLPVLQKIEAFEYAWGNSDGNDLARVLWQQSQNSEVWLERRTNFTRSIAVMSMVGYVLGLGDRHPSNLMLDKISGRIAHVDFGDCKPHTDSHVCVR
jgi:FKBP12-rapamycin complex-associated protein